jgi:hypothetical protein
MRDLFYHIRDNPELVAEFFTFVQEQPNPDYEKRIGDRTWLKVDHNLVEQMV